MVVYELAIALHLSPATDETLLRRPQLREPGFPGEG
jgi:hypothetical protein